MGDYSHLTPAQLRKVADQLLEQTADRGLMVRIAAACKVRELRIAANAKEANPHG